MTNFILKPFPLLVIPIKQTLWSVGRSCNDQQYCRTQVRFLFLTVLANVDHRQFNETIVAYYLQNKVKIP